MSIEEKNHLKERKNKQKEYITHSSLFREPSIIAAYVQLLINVLIAGGLFYMLVHLFYMIRNDVQKKIDQIIRIEINKVKLCEKNYLMNQCDPAVRVPALENICSEWFQCINDGEIITKNSFYTLRSAKLWTQTIADIINTFIDEIKLKAFIFIIILILSSITAVNVIFSRLVTSLKQE